MSDNQEMQFADPAWEPGKTREFPVEEEMPPLQIIEPPAFQSVFPGSGGPSSPADQATADYSQGYRPQTTSYPSQTNSPPQQRFQTPTQPSFRSLPPWLWIVICIALISAVSGPLSISNSFNVLVSLIITLAVISGAWLLMTKRVRVQVNGEKQATETRTFTVTAKPTVIITNKAGAIHLRSGQPGQVGITTEKRGYIFSPQWNRDAQLGYEQNTTLNQVSARVDNWGLFGKGTIDFAVTVPPECHLELRTNAGQIHVENVSGQMHLQANAGTINVNEVTLEGDSRVKTDVGSISFVGKLDPAGKATLSTDVGTINATLPAQSSFLLDAKASLGAVTTNLPFAQPQRMKTFGKVGPGPHPSLRMKVDLGTIDVQRL